MNMMNVFQMIHVQMLLTQVGLVMVTVIVPTIQTAVGMVVTVVNLLV
jgi:hypothetical protein